MLVDCVWNDWDNWSSCSKLCGSGQQSRTRTTKVAAQGGGKECIGPKKSTKVCNAQVCIGNDWHFNPSKHQSLRNIINYCQRKSEITS